ncbi:hypothetical protein QBC40DRAFT_312113 [Triangularia verruculosa]|uniref:Uncharacterized protein n=1 Tax=Triangularia verruculosa TaxID=2587418 RepID=A0AAN6XRW2_9PEZI|nr:hypothetical protein QBC40DRAFT_312113 [Triangularia verruculosa]
MARTPSKPITAMVDSAAQPIPRPRGRPKKITTPAEDHTSAVFTPIATPTAQSEQPIVTPRSRGRPKKKPHHRSKQALEAARLLPEAQLKSNHVGEEDETPSEQPTAAPRPRGRPKKQDAADTSSILESEDEKKTAFTDADIAAAKDDLRAEIRTLSDGSPHGRSAPPTRRGRGRPRKTSAVETTFDVMQGSQEEAEDTHEAPRTETTSIDNHAPVKRGRGRPRKSDTLHISPTSTTPTATRGGRGRPKENSADTVDVGGDVVDGETGDNHVEKDEDKKNLREFVVQDESDMDEDEDYEPSLSSTRSPSPPTSQSTVFRKRGDPVILEEPQNPKKRLSGFAVARKTASISSFPKANTTQTVVKSVDETSYTAATTSPLLSSLVGEYSVKYVIPGDRVHPGRLTVKFATDDDDLLAGSLELSRWSAVMRIGLTEQKIQRYIVKQERIESQGLVLSDIMHLDEDEGISLPEDGISADDDTATHKRKASSELGGELPSKYRKVTPMSLSEVHTLYFAYRVKHVLSGETQHKAQVGTIQFYTTKNGESAFENALISVPGYDQAYELCGEARKDTGPRWPSQDWLWGDFADPRSD